MSWSQGLLRRGQLWSLGLLRRRHLSARRTGHLLAALLTAAALVGVPADFGRTSWDLRQEIAVTGAGPLPDRACSAAGRRPPTRELTLHLPGRDGDRVARVRVPARGARGPAPLLVALHGGGASGPFMEGYSGLARLADHRGFVVAFPSATGPRRFWNLGPDRAPDDVGFVAALIERVATLACIDARRVFAVGVSNGGGLAARVGCELSDRVAGIVVVSGGFGHLPRCQPRRSVSVLEIHGTADRVVPYRGDPRDGAGDVRAWLAGWARRDRCTARAPDHIVARRTVRVDWHGCASGTAVAHLRVLGGGHQWPGATPPDPGPPSTLSAARETWAFLERLPARSGR